jgi:hypothetical protein
MRGRNVTDSLKQLSVGNDFSPSLSTSASLAESSAASHWDFINNWNVLPQSNDRTPVFGAAVPGSASAAAHRSSVRRKHQEMFKAWSQERHD